LPRPLRPLSLLPARPFDGTSQITHHKHKDRAAPLRFTLSLLSRPKPSVSGARRAALRLP